MKFIVTLDRDEDGVWIAECPAIPGCVSQGGTREEALANVKDAIKLCLEVRTERGLPLTVETHQVEVRMGHHLPEIVGISLDIPTQASASEQAGWTPLAMEALEKAYGDNEPDYPLDAIIEKNPQYEGR
jgi:predicted RNase H-like HicB family nuclease